MVKPGQIIDDPQKLAGVALSTEPAVQQAVQGGTYQKCIVSSTYDLYFVPPPNASEAVALGELRRRIRRLGNGDEYPISEGVLRTFLEKAGADKNDSRATTRSEANQLVEELLDSAVRAGASDVHINVRNQTEVKHRINGILVDGPRLSSKVGTEIVTVLFQSYAQVPYGNEEARDGLFYFSSGGRDYAARLNKLRMAGGGVTCKMRIRDTAEVIDLETAGYSAAQLKVLKEMMGRGQGLLVVTGGVNSGKSTTMTSLLAAIPEHYSVLELSDTVEVRLPNVCHVELPADGEHLDKRIAAVQDSTVRQDSDYLAIGEMRNRQTASKAEVMALQGRFVLSTGHAYDPVAFFLRMISPSDFGMSENTVLSPRFMVGLVSQALVETLCRHCALDAPSDAAVAHSSYKDREALERKLDQGLGPELVQSVRYQNPAGCEACGHTGLSGRTVVAEMLPFSPKLCEMFRTHEYDVRGYMATWGLRTKHEHGLSKVLRGEVDPLLLGRRIDAPGDSNVMDWGNHNALAELAEER